MEVRGCLAIAVVAAIAVLMAAGAYLFVALRRPEGAPLARMYRTEAGLRALMTAVETYRGDLGVYPEPGSAGLERAMRYLSRNVDYLPAGTPTDAWERPYRYAPSTAYEQPDSQALRDADGMYYAAGRYQLYSAGADGMPGLGDPEAFKDNITSWDPERSWREFYRRLNAAYTPGKDNR